MAGDVAEPSRWVILVGDLEHGFTAEGPYSDNDIQQVWDDKVAKDQSATALPLTDPYGIMDDFMASLPKGDLYSMPAPPAAEVNPQFSSTVLNPYAEAASQQPPSYAEQAKAAEEMRALARIRAEEQSDWLADQFHASKPGGGIRPEVRARRSNSRFT